MTESTAPGAPEPQCAEEGSGGPLAGLRVVELANIGPSAHAALLLADLGADVVRVRRPGDLAAEEPPRDQLYRGRRVVEADLKQPSGVAVVRDLLVRADVLVEGYRPGVAERMGLGPGPALEANPRLVYARVTGWGQDGPRAGQAGHDINFIAPTGILHAVGRPDDRPVPPLNLIGGFGGGSMFLVAGVLAALWERQSSGHGQVVDASMAEGASVLAQHSWSLRASGGWSDERGSNLVDGSCPFMDTYLCADGRYMAVGAFEPQFFARLLDTLQLDAASVPGQQDRARWPELREALAERFATQTRDTWAKVFSEVDACVTPVLSFSEAPEDPQLRSRGAFAEIDGVVQPLPAPRFSRTPAPRPKPPARRPTPAEELWRTEQASDAGPRHL
ncbi:CaiB/BaiF CoA transferase family protein [Streptomyces sulphureus]|uniref:CaiB/BaiF CoA transferase family protein n=1 Tax=Streptomyces sulphureus TaxID=47758 RepID=UPI0003613E31|nr:CaiB/BaiF CoA-transferase family protein [Streptomyces sulphureus]